MNSNSNSQSPISVDGSPVGQTQPPAPPQQPSVPSNTHKITGNTQNQPHTRTGTQTHTRTPTRVKRQFWFRIFSGGDNLLTLADKLLAANFGAVIALLASRLDGSLFRYLSSKLADAKSFDTVVACFAIGFTCNIHVILLQKDSPIAAKIGGYAGVMSSVIGFLTMIQILLPPTLLWIVWSAAASIFLSFLYHFANNWVAAEDVNVMFYWRDNNQVKTMFCEVKKGSTLGELEAKIMPKVAPTGENVQLKFKCRIPCWQSQHGVQYDLVEIEDDDTLAFFLNKSKSLWPVLTLQFNVEWDGSTTPVGGGGSFTQSLQTESPPPPPTANRVVNITSSVQCTQEYFPTTL